jgi:hypothetical protein
VGVTKVWQWGDRWVHDIVFKHVESLPSFEYLLVLSDLTPVRFGNLHARAWMIESDVVEASVSGAAYWENSFDSVNGSARTGGTMGDGGASQGHGQHGGGRVKLESQGGSRALGRVGGWDERELLGVGVQVVVVWESGVGEGPGHVHRCVAWRLKDHGEGVT